MSIMQMYEKMFLTPYLRLSVKQQKEVQIVSWGPIEKKKRAQILQCHFRHDTGENTSEESVKIILV